jgi:hypothetical protein
VSKTPASWRRATPLRQSFPYFLISQLCSLDLIDKRAARESAQVPMLPRVISNLKTRIGHQLLSSRPVGEHPFTAGEEGRPDVLLSQIVDNVTLVAGNFMRLLAKVERQSYELPPGRQLDATDHATLSRRDG